MNITKGKMQSAQKVCLYGVEGIGKSTFAAQFPDPLFIDTEGSTKHLDVRRFDPPTSWAMLLSQVEYVTRNPDVCKTLVIDTADWAERLCVESVCAKGNAKGLEDFGYGKGYVYLKEEFGRLINALSDVIGKGVHVVVTAHAAMRKQELPDELGAFDRWELKLSKGNSEKGVAAMVKEWADMVLFANYKTLVVNVDSQGAAKGKNKARGGQRVIYTSHMPTWDAKNRHNLPDELPFEYSAVAHCFMDTVPPIKKDEPQQAAPPPADPTKLPGNPFVSAPSATPPVDLDKAVPDEPPARAPAPARAPMPPNENIHPKLRDLMIADKVCEFEIQGVVGNAGFFPENMLVELYPVDFVEQMLIAEWGGKVRELIKEYRKDALPF